MDAGKQNVWQYVRQCYIKKHDESSLESFSVCLDYGNKNPGHLLAMLESRESHVIFNVRSQLQISADCSLGIEKRCGVFTTTCYICVLRANAFDFLK